MGFNPFHLGIGWCNCQRQRNRNTSDSDSNRKLALAVWQKVVGWETQQRQLGVTIPSVLICGKKKINK
jgi:hypothetical protein